MSAALKPRDDLRLTGPTVAPVIDRGLLMSPADVGHVIFQGNVGGRWVLEHAPMRYRVKVGRKVLFYETDMRAWAESLRQGDR